MSLEAATYVNQLVVSNPEGADPKGQGDDHLRLIKNTLKNTFPNLDAAVTVTPAELNALSGGTALFKTGMILLWSGSIASIPTGWALCNGTAGTPNLTDRFVVGAGDSYAVGSAGGTQLHTHSISVVGTGLTVEQMPPHNHVAQFQVPAGSSGYPGFDGSGDAWTTGVTTTTGSGAAHTHGASASVIDHRPPYFALAYIRKT